MTETGGMEARSVLVLGGARSGKSRTAETLAQTSGLRLVYLATAGPPRDGEMADRIALHRHRRGTEWTTVEEPLDLVGAVERSAGAETVVLVDCLTLWLSNLMAEGRDVDAETERLCGALREVAGPVILVSNEVGGGIVPENALARAFRDHQGRLNQAVAAIVDAAVLVVAGRALVLPGASCPDIALR
ncbi:bifunctional adenosylcobinamide kinase/adenosylcobinamide-phosphate guanylyltransferase [Amorphus orientalis]|uniref:Bifunctional adenosylcobalamin biosynthesis protein n=1 Tax=Amorphus orientalis TaxID=649198 RepID=A0AAE3VR47_9HYPH|nr:bifunctional adenosylcobinamide kinase/adenosylcobinamide-phosphate guanylyltransferase [Amorphus orientalis]MDQ0316315.1 adenosylcobinamide kinase/adenosylcobinamide-phosphate guanylyltransferase [Amorphus orientalis]